MKKVFVLFIILMPIIAWAQNDGAKSKEKISEVKQSEDEFIYADQTCTTSEQALKRANEIMMKELQNYFQLIGIDFETVKDKVADNMVTITMQRGDQFRAFVYIDKSFLDEKEQPQVVQKQNDGIFSPMATMTSRLQVYDYVNRLQNEGNPVVFVNQPKGNEMDKMYLILYKRGGTIEVILTPMDAEGTRHDLASGKPDSVENHPNTSINGIKIEQ